MRSLERVNIRRNVRRYVRMYVLTYIRTGQTLYPLHNFVVRGDKYLMRHQKFPTKRINSSAVKKTWKFKEKIFAS